MAVVKFGAFELHSDSGELRKYGIRIRLQAKPLQVLQCLLENPGKVVSREEIRSRLWDEGTFVDFESGLNTATNRLRTALGDSADAPRYIETLPGLGYRFIGL
ncbi:MAG: winged helix-turn-helix domain-containing protein [Acidobacteriaceae bacterium]|nr:winged helix-turn-helix domain-containing protein [Acidobacteriaceae bacterium]MBV9503345.1 winged helix-turn-helix domain-containing protein [Acidobacteriaceae bacterium]